MSLQFKARSREREGGRLLGKFAYVFEPWNALDKDPTPSEPADGQSAVVEQTADGRKLDQDGFDGRQ